MLAQTKGNVRRANKFCLGPLPTGRSEWKTGRFQKICIITRGWIWLNLSQLCSSDFQGTADDQGEVSPEGGLSSAETQMDIRLNPLVADRQTVVHGQKNPRSNTFCIRINGVATVRQTRCLTVCKLLFAPVLVCWWSPRGPYIPCFGTRVNHDNISSQWNWLWFRFLLAACLRFVCIRILVNFTVRCI